MSILYLVPTPIGNLSDITYRAVEVLKSVDAILCEDTRVSGKLLRHLEIKKPLIAFHQHNEHKLTPRIIERLKGNETLALISDAGTPGISDPGYLVVSHCIENNIVVQSLPGATAFVPALVNSGLSSDKFVFEGFLPHKKGRQTRLKFLSEESRTILLYESPHRLLKCLKQLDEFFGERKAVVCREITKLHEETVRGNIKELIEHFNDKKVKGEIVIIIEGNKSNV